MPADTPKHLPIRPDAVVFDWDNTLVDTWPVIHAALATTFEAMGKEPWTLEQTKQRVAKSLRESFPGHFGDRWEEAAEIFYDAFASFHLERLESMDNALLLLETINHAGIPCCIVSNKTARFLRKEVEHLGWTSLVHSVIGATDAEKDKPDPAPMLMALEGTGVLPSASVWYVGDSMIDIEFAEATGCYGILVHTATTKPDAAEKADYTACDLAELASVFNRLQHTER